MSHPGRKLGKFGAFGREVVEVEQDERQEWLEAVYGAFGVPVTRDRQLRQFLDSVFRDQRVMAVRSTSGYLATAAAIETSLTLPGGHAVEAWCLTGLTVDSTGRRRGLLRAAMSKMHSLCAEAGIAAAVLCPSEWPIYGRFGYGPAVWFDAVAAPRRALYWRDDEPQHESELTKLAGEDARNLAERLYKRRVSLCPGELKPPDAYWTRFTHDSTYNGIDSLLGLSSDDAVVRHCIGFADRGLVAYRLIPGWTAESTPNYSLQITDLLAADRNAEAALWRHVLSVDLVTEIAASRVALDHPLRWWLTDARLLRSRRHDGLWVRPLNVAALLENRSWSGSDVISLRVHDHEGFACGSYLLEVDGGRALCTRRDVAEPDLEMEASTLGAIILGGTSARSMAASGRVRARDLTSARRWDALATPERAPFTSYPL